LRHVLKKSTQWRYLDHLHTEIFEDAAIEPRRKATVVVMRLLMQATAKRSTDDEQPTGLQDTNQLPQSPNRIGNMLEHFRAHDGIELAFLDGDARNVANIVDVPVTPFLALGAFARALVLHEVLRLILRMRKKGLVLTFACPSIQHLRARRNGSGQFCEPL